MKNITLLMRLCVIFCFATLPLAAEAQETTAQKSMDVPLGD